MTWIRELIHDPKLFRSSIDKIVIDFCFWKGAAQMLLPKIPSGS